MRRSRKKLDLCETCWAAGPLVDGVGTTCTLPPSHKGSCQYESNNDILVTLTEIGAAFLEDTLPAEIGERP